MVVFPLRDEMIDIWFLDLTRVQKSIQLRLDILDVAEKNRIEFYQDAQARLSYLTCRVLLKELLCCYTRIPANEQKITYSDFGKPRLIGPGVFFNLSRSNGKAALAFCRQQDIGIDLEDTSQLEVTPDLVDRVFSPAEKAQLQKLEREEYTQCFFHVWTQKEAYLKAIGMGLSQEMGKVSVSISTSDSSTLTDEVEKEIGGWKIFTKSLFGSFEMAVCAGRGMHTLQCFDLTAFISKSLAGRQKHQCVARKQDFFLAEYKL